MNILDLVLFLGSSGELSSPGGWCCGFFVFVKSAAYRVLETLSLETLLEEDC